MRVAFRVDAGPSVGTGHLVRCLVLAAELRDRGAEIVFVTGGLPIALQDRIAQVALSHHVVEDGVQGGPPVASPNRQIEDAHQTLVLLESSFDVVVVDHYGLSAPWQQAVSGYVDRMMVIDDLADREHDCDLLLDQNWSGPATAARYDQLLPSRCRRLLGPRYALLHPRYPTVRASRPDVASPPRRVLVSFGGSDPTRETLKFLRSLPGTVELPAIDVVVGGAFDAVPSIEELARALPSVTVHRDVPHLADLLAVADLAVGAGGTTTWERICLEVPSLVTTVAENQREVVSALAAAGAITWVGEASETTPTTYADHWASALNGDVPTPPPLVDGYGAQRVALCLMPPSSSELRVRRAERVDAPTFVGSDPGCSPSLPSYLDGDEVWRPHLRRFKAMLEASTGRVLVAEIQGVPVGGAWLDDQHDAPAIWLDDAIGDSQLLPILAGQVRRFSAPSDPR